MEKFGIFILQQNNRMNEIQFGQKKIQKTNGLISQYFFSRLLNIGQKLKINCCVKPVIIQPKNKTMSTITMFELLEIKLKARNFDHVQSMTEFFLYFRWI